MRNFAAFRDASIQKQLKLIEHVQAEAYDTCKQEPEVESVTYDEDDFANYITTEYLEDIEEEEEPEVVEEALQDETKIKKEPKKYYKRALCGLCGNSYYKDQLQRHIDVS